MSEIEVTGIPSDVDESRLKLLFHEFGKIEEINYKRCGVKKCSGVCNICFNCESSALQACEYDGINLHNHKINIKPKGRELNKKLFSRTDILLILLVAIISFASHFPLLSFPNVVVFDETHFGSFINGYITGVRFFDIHPPFAKLIYAAYAKAVGYDGNFSFQNEITYPDYVYVRLRIFPCFCGAIIAPILTASMILRRCSASSSLMTGLLFALDFTSIVQSRFILTDAIVYLFVALTIFFSCYLTRVESWTIIILQCFFASAAFCSKFAAGGTFVLVAISNFRLLIGRKYGFMSLCVRGVVCVTIAVTLLFSTVLIHLLVTPIEGYGDKYCVGNFRLLPYTVQIKYLIWDMYRYNRDLNFSHPYQSRWYDWPIFRAIPTLIWSNTQFTQLITIFNNPLSAFCSLIGALFCVYFFKFEWFFTWAFSFLPFALVKRCTWTYHYETALIYGICGFCFWIDRIPKRFRRYINALVICLTVAAFVYWMPWLYGMEQTRKQISKRAIWPKLVEYFNI